MSQKNMKRKDEKKKYGHKNQIELNFKNLKFYWQTKMDIFRIKMGLGQNYKNI